MTCRTSILVVAALLGATPLLSAQEGERAAPAGEEMPNPKTLQHDALKAFAGSWTNTCKMAAMPGVPGREEAQEVTGTEECQLLCDGLYLRSRVFGSFAGEPYEGMWIAGYDPTEKTYSMLWVDQHEPSPMVATGTFDAATRTWEFSGESTQGPMRSVVTFADADHFAEKCYGTGADGEETCTMEITRQRARQAATRDATAKRSDAPPSDELAELHKTIGEWDATMRMQMAPGAPWTEEPCSESVIAICNGKWLWSDFRGQMMGMPFEGHSLMGYDTNEEQYVSFWIDSWSPAPMKSTGHHDPASKAMVMTGKTVDMTGQPMTTKERVTWRDQDTRVLTMEFESAEGPSTMEIVYKRKHAAK